LSPLSSTFARQYPQGTLMFAIAAAIVSAALIAFSHFGEKE